MKIALIGPGIMPIPPPGWGAVEILIWDYYKELSNQGHQVDIINKMRQNDYEQNDSSSKYCKDLIEDINNNKYDFVHIHYDVLFHTMKFLTCKKVAITSHYPYIDQLNKHKYDGYDRIFTEICSNNNHFIFALSKKDYDVFKNYSINTNNIGLLINAANSKEINLLEDCKCKYIDKSIYVAKIEPRKNQHKYYMIQNLDFYGRCDANNNFRQLECYKGELEHTELIETMRNYGNLVLLSDGESDPLVIKEALMAGLPIVTNSYCINDLDISLPFIDIIPNNKLDDIQYITEIINENRKKQQYKREIREYAINNFSYENLIHRYIEKIKSI